MSPLRLTGSLGLRHFLQVSATSSPPPPAGLWQKTWQPLLASRMLTRRPPPASGKPEFIFQEILSFFCPRPRKAYLSPALIWLEEEGWPTAEKEAQDKAVEGEMEKEAVMRRALGKWKRMNIEEKAVWRMKAEERAKTNQKK